MDKFNALIVAEGQLLPLSFIQSLSSKLHFNLITNKVIEDQRTLIKDYDFLFWDLDNSPISVDLVLNDLSQEQSLLRPFIIGFTSAENIKLGIDCIQHGMDDFLMKPTDVDLLTVKVNKLMKLRNDILALNCHRQDYQNLLRTLVHDMSNYLMIIHGYLGVLKEEIIGNEKLNKISSLVHNIVELVGGIKALENLKSNGKTTYESSESFPEIFNSLKALFSQALEGEVSKTDIEM